MSKSHPTDATEPAPQLGTEAWLTLGSVFLAFLYLCGYSGVTSFTAAFGVNPGDFGIDEKEYFIYGLEYMMPDISVTQKLSVSSIVSAPWLIWLAFVCLLPALFSNWQRKKTTQKSQWLRLMVRSTTLIPLALFLFIAAGKEGEKRALHAESRLDSLPLTTLAYKGEGCTNGSCHLWGKLLFRTQKIVCLTQVNAHDVCGNYITNGLEGHLFTIPAERVVYISTFLPSGAKPTTQNEDTH